MNSKRVTLTILAVVMTTWFCASAARAESDTVLYLLLPGVNVNGELDLYSLSAFGECKIVFNKNKSQVTCHADVINESAKAYNENPYLHPTDLYEPCYLIGKLTISASGQAHFKSELECQSQ